MSIEEEFKQYQDIWDDCYLGYVILENQKEGISSDAIKTCFSEKSDFNFYPWVSENEELTFPSNGLNEIELDEFEKLFSTMAQEAIAYGSNKRLSDEELNNLLASFLSEFTDPSYYCNFTNSGWRPVTKHSRDSLLCVVGKNKLGMWLSCNDE